MLIWKIFQKYPHLADELEKRRHRKAYKKHLKAKLQALIIERRRLYGIDGNLLVEGLEFPRDQVEAILDGTFKPRFIDECMLVSAVYRRYPHLENAFAKRRHRKWLEVNRREPEATTPYPLGYGPFYGVDGNLLVEDIDCSRASVESILNGTFKRMYPATVFKRYPQLRDELKKRCHRKAYRAYSRSSAALLSVFSAGPASAMPGSGMPAFSISTSLGPQRGSLRI
jgi:hypothetical protein